jgi:peptidoglycan/LPS O-acetylase OafA/YrhL
MTDHLRFLSQRTFCSLDGLRAISILAVIWHHTTPPTLKGPLAHVGSHGVTLFFAISGFLITTLLLRERKRTGVLDLKAFYMRRALRIFPLYYGVLVLYIVSVWLFERNTSVGQAFFGNLKYFATYTSNLFVPLDGRVIFYFAWSLAAEEQFYLIWPPVLLMTVTIPRAFSALCLVFVAGISGQLLGSKFLSAVPLAIVAGALLAVALHTERGFYVVRNLIGGAWSFGMLAIALVVVLTVISTPNFVIHALFAAIVGSCVLRENHPVAPFLTLKPMAYIGSISYGMYMLHMLCKNAVVKLLGAVGIGSKGLEVFVLTLGVTAVVAGLSFKYYESVFLKLKTSYQR